MTLKIKKDGIIYACEEGFEDRAIGTLFPNATEEDERIIECGSEAIPIVEEFIEKVNSGKFTPKTVVKEFEQLLLRHAV